MKIRTNVLKTAQCLTMSSERFQLGRISGLALILLILIVADRGAAQSTLLVSTSNNTIRKFSLTGQDLGIFASSGLSGPLGLAFDRFGNLYVANISSNTIREFSPTGQDLGIFASTGLNEPLTLAFDSAGDLFVSNNGDNTIRKFSPTGQDLGIFASLLGIGCPGGLSVNRSGNLLVADICSSVVREFSLAGQNLGIFASMGLSNPLGLAFDGSGDLFVSNTDNGGQFRNTIRKLSPTGQDLGIFASTGLGFPAGLVVDRSGNLFVANEEQRPGQIDYSIREFSPTGQDLGDFVVLPDQPRFLVIAVPAFAGTPGTANCHGQSVSTLVQQFGGLDAAASALGFPDVQSMQSAILTFCRR